MTKWDQRVAEHDAVRLLEELDTSLGKVEAKDASESEDVERLKRVVMSLRQVVENIDAQLLTLESLNNLASPLQSIAASIESWSDQRDPQLLAQANTYADQALNVVIPVSLGAGAVDSEGLRRSAESFRRSAGQLVRGLTDEVEAAKEKLNHDRDAIQQDLAALGNKASEIKDALDQHQASLASQLEAQAETFGAAEKERKETFDSHVASQSSEFEKALGVAVEKGEETVASLETKGEEIVTSMREQHESAEKLLDAIGRTGTEFGFKEYAEAEKEQANRWRLLAVWSMVAIVAMGLWIVVTAHNAPILDVSESLLKFAVTVPLGAIAAYAGRQSHQHRTNEISARMLHLDIRAIDPYIALLPTEEQHAIKAEMARRIFGHRVPVGPQKGAGEVPLHSTGVRDLVSRTSGEEKAKGAA